MKRMAKCSLSSSIFFAIFLVNFYNNCEAYVPPPALVEPLYPLGLRISIPGEMRSLLSRYILITFDPINNLIEVLCNRLMIFSFYIIQKRSYMQM